MGGPKKSRDQPKPSSTPLSYALMPLMPPPCCLQNPSNHYRLSVGFYLLRRAPDASPQISPVVRGMGGP